MKIALIFLISISFFISCTNNDVFSHTKEIENSIWIYDDPFTASFKIMDTLGYDIFLSVNHGNYYPFENIYIKITDDFSGEISTDTVSIDLADEYGVWKGKGSSNRKHNTLLRNEFSFPDTGIYNIKIEQFTRTDSLREVEQIAVFIKRS
jgi:gliding motility-associated lipoprotein GldH